MIPNRCIRLSDQKCISLSSLGLGTYSMSGTEGKEAIKMAIDLGYRMFDTAVAYGNEAIVGEAIREKLREYNHLTREDFFVISKLCGTQHRFDLVEKCCIASVERLGLDYVDLYLMHTPVALQRTESTSTKGTVLDSFDDTISPTEAWFGLEKCYQEGICRSIGVSNFNEHQLNTLLQEGSTLPAANQIECSVGFCPSAQVCLRYLIDGDVVPIVKSSNVSRQQENMDVFDFKLTTQQVEELDAVTANQRACKMHHLAAAKHYPFRDIAS